MTDALRLKGQILDGDWLLFGINDLFHTEDGKFKVCVEDVGMFKVDPATIRLAEDPRKQMLAEIRQRINGLPGTNYSCAGDTVYIHQEVNRKRVSEIIDEMEAKL